MEINILLGKVPAKQLGAPVDYLKVVHSAYSNQYLQALGVEPSERHRRVVARNCPLQKCVIEATWGDGSAVADQLRILPPNSEKPEDRHDRGELITIQSDPLMMALPPDTSGIYERAKGSAGSRKLTAEERCVHALHEMRQKDQRRSEQAFGGGEQGTITLTQELEEFHMLAKGEEGPVHRREVLRQWGKDGFKELEMLKRKFILPFACQAILSGFGGSSSSPGQSSIWSSGEVPRLSPQLARPLQVTWEQIQEEATEYAESGFPLELLSTRKDALLFDDIRKCLQSMDMARLIGLSSHLVYWNAFGHLYPPERRLSESTRHSLALSMQEVWAKLQARAGKARAQEFCVPVFLLFLKWGIEQTLRLQYSKLLDDVDYGEDATFHMVSQINVTIMGLFDPDCIAANFGTLDCCPEAIKLWRKLHINQMKHGLTPATRTIAREFRTSPMMLLLMNSDGGPSDPKTRKLLQKSSSESVLTAVAGKGSKPRTTRHLDSVRKSSLYHTACSRLGHVGHMAMGEAK